MSSLSISLCVIIFISIGYCTAELTCGPNESVDSCPRNCFYDYCPTHENQDSVPCPKPTKCPPPACKCNFNYRRDKNNTCIPTQDCPPFECSRTNEMFDSCPSYCPGDDCRNANPTGECPFLTLLTVNCSPSCRCKPHHWRNNSTCVPYPECPGIKQQLEEQMNEERPLINF